MGNKKAIVFSTDRLSKILLEAASLLLQQQQLNKEVDAFEIPQLHLCEKREKLIDKIDTWIATNIVDT